MFGFKKSAGKDTREKEIIQSASVKEAPASDTPKEKINFYVPDFYNNAPLYVMISGFIEHIPEWFYDDFKIAAAYGCFPSVIWNGGRVYFDRVTRHDMDRVIDALNQCGIAVRYTFTNPLLEEKHMSDTLGNICLEAANNGMNEVLVNTPAMEAYVRANYPDYKIISSVTKCIKTVEGVEEELKKDYYLVVLDSSLNKDERIFQIEGRDRLELLVDHACRLNCPRREVHYNEVGNCQLTYTESKFSCPHIGKTFEELMRGPHVINRDLMAERYIPGGFKHFKLDGRAFLQETLVDTLVHYMVRPQYQAKFKDIIRKEVYSNDTDW